MKEELIRLSELATKHRDSIHGEQHTKNVLIEPVLKLLGFSITNPYDIITEYSADFGVKRGEKVDYALLKDKEVAMLVEAKDWKIKLESKQVSQLFRYFSVSRAKIGILTNGLDYMFFTDILKENTMDMKPFFTFNIMNYTPSDVSTLMKFSKKALDVHSIRDMAKEMLINVMLTDFLSNQVKEPSLEFINLVLQDTDISGTDMLETKRIAGKALRSILASRIEVAVGVQPEEKAILSNKTNGFTGKLSGLVSIDSFTNTNTTGTKPMELIFVDAKYDVKTWSEVLVSALVYVHWATKNKKFMLSIGASSPRQKAWVSKSIEGLQTPKPIGSSGLFVDTCASASLHIARLRSICSILELEEKDVFIRLR